MLRAEALRFAARRLSSVRRGYFFVIRIPNIGFQVTRLPMRQRMIAVIHFFALDEGFAIWHASFVRVNENEFHPRKPHGYVVRKLTGKPQEGVVSKGGQAFAKGTGQTSGERRVVPLPKAILEEAPKHSESELPIYDRDSGSRVDTYY